MMRLLFIPLVLVSFLSGCDKKKEPLTGLREEVFQDTLSFRAELKRDVEMAKVENNHFWAMAGGNARHVMSSVAYQAEKGEIWRKTVSHSSGNEARLVNGPIIAEGKVFVMDAEGEVNAVDLDTGAELWIVKTFPEGPSRQAFGGGLAYEDGVVFATTASAEVLGIAAKTGEILWRHSVSAPIRSAPTVAEGRVYVLTINNQLDVFDCKTGQMLWTHTGIMESAGILGGSSVAVLGGVVLVPYSSGEIFALRQDTGAVLWSDSLAAMKAVDSMSSLAHIKARPIIHHGKGLVISHSGRMNLYDLRTGGVLWSKDIGGIRSPAVIENTFFMVSNDGVLLAIDYDSGKIIWSKVLPQTRELKTKGERILWAGPVLVNQQLALTGSHGKLIFCSLKDGAIENVMDIGSGTMLSPVGAEKTLILLTDQGDVIAYR